MGISEFVRASSPSYWTVFDEMEFSGPSLSPHENAWNRLPEEEHRKASIATDPAALLSPHHYWKARDPEAHGWRSSCHCRCYRPLPLHIFPWKASKREPCPERR